MREIIEELNKKHAVTMLGGKCVILNDIKDPVFNRPDISFSSVADFKNRYSNRKLSIPGPDGDIYKPLAKAWLESPYRRQYEGVIFEPNGENNGYYNLWRGLAIEPKKGNWKLFKDHLYEIICRGNPEYIEYLLCWMANIIQNPGGERPGTAIVMRGPQGTGKGCFASNFGKIFGNHYLHINNQKHLTGNFNSHLKDCIILFADEGYWAGDKGGEGIIKGLITEDKLMIEPKGKDAFMIKNHVHLIMASNSDWVVPAGFDERRFFVLDVSSDRVRDREYFNKLFSLMDDGGCEAMLYDLLEYDTSIVDLRTIPKTRALLEQVMKSLDSVSGFWLDCLADGAIGADNTDWPDSMKIKDVYDAYISHAEKQGQRYREGVQHFGVQLKKLCPGIKKKRPREGASLSRPQYYFFPEKEVCRVDFEKAIGMDVPWEEE